MVDKPMSNNDDCYVNQSLCATSTSRMTNVNVDTNIIKEFTRHLSNAVDVYEHIDDNVRRHASAIIQSHKGKVASATVSKPPVDETCEKDSESAARVASTAVDNPMSNNDDCEVFKEKPMEIPDL